MTLALPRRTNIPRPMKKDPKHTSDRVFNDLACSITFGTEIVQVNMSLSFLWAKFTRYYHIIHVFFPFPYIIHFAPAMPLFLRRQWYPTPYSIHHQISVKPCFLLYCVLCQNTRVCRRPRHCITSECVQYCQIYIWSSYTSFFAFQLNGMWNKILLNTIMTAAYMCCYEWKLMP